jgi:hypothetical protein
MEPCVVSARRISALFFSFLAPRSVFTQAFDISSTHVRPATPALVSPMESTFRHSPLSDTVHFQTQFTFRHSSLPSHLRYGSRLYPVIYHRYFSSTNRLQMSSVSTPTAQPNLNAAISSEGQPFSEFMVVSQAQKREEKYTLLLCQGNDKHTL